ncbi:hypothetical protein N7516_001691 [Penicillium verrucosum]|uniref:uncharacterized protein n=1 Tax=Penicillium verrucosum TaxID=60171 RepID=UPI002544FC80|nr:uncharacterized protein N7516_001691 [Penicillium verrucosum]KAJ5941523.1 hypothetical protein N7516_001691 [Penicillium verrucosum]
MATHPFCCTTIQPTKLPNPDHEQTFTEFTKWALLTTTGNLTGSTDPSEASVCIQLVRQVPNGPIECIRYFVASDKHGNFEEVSKDGILEANFVTINETKGFQCTQHNRVFDLNLYEPSTGSSHHWRANIAKPLKQLENAIKYKISRSGSGSSGSGYGYGSGMGYGSAWGASLGSGCGPNWGTGSSTVFDKHMPSSTTVETGSNDSDSDSDGEDQGQVQVQDQNQEAGIPLSEDGNQDGNEDQLISSSPMFDTQVTGDYDAESYSPPESQLTYYEDGVSQSYLDTEDYGCYYYRGPSDDYGSYDCDGGNNDSTYDQDC